MDPADGRHQVYTMDVWDHRHRMLKSWNQLIFSSWAFWHHLPFLLFSLTAHNLCCLYARNRRGAVGAKARMNKLDRRVPQCLDKDALSLLHTSPWSLEPSRAIVNIHMQSISAQGETPLTKSQCGLEGVGAKKFGMSLETREIKLFWRDIPGSCRDIPGVPEKFEKKRFVFNSRSLVESGKLRG